MIKPEQVPDEALAAFESAFDGFLIQNPLADHSSAYRTAIAAALNAWPDRQCERGYRDEVLGRVGGRIILPLGDDK